MEQTTVQTPTVPQISMPTSALMTTLMALIDNYIKDIVSAQVNEILMSHRTLRVIDDGFVEQIKEIATAVVEGAISEHNDAEYHISEDAINDMAVSAVEDHDFESQIDDAVHSALNEWDFSDVVTTAIKDNITFSVTVD
jgi:hypothetical protein